MDFKGQARDLVNRIFGAAGSSLNKDLARSAVEISLREAYAQGLKDAGASSRELRGGTGTTGGAQSSRSEKTAYSRASRCDHRWVESFQDGSSVENKCAECGISQKDVQSKCDHFFVKVGADEICVACRKPRRSAQ